MTGDTIKSLIVGIFTVPAVTGAGGKTTEVDLQNRVELQLVPMWANCSFCTCRTKK